MKINNSLLFIFTLASAVAAGIFFCFVHGFVQPSGVDGYYYIKQIKFFGETHGLYFQDRSFAYALPFLLQTIFNNELLSYQISTSLVVALLIGAQLLLAQCFLKISDEKKWILATAAMGFCIFNVSVFEITMNYYKNAFALMCFSYGLVCTLWYIDDRKAKFLLSALLFYVFCLFSHKSGILWILAIGLSGALAFWRNLPKKRLMTIVASLAVAGLVFFLFFQNTAAFVRFSTQSLVFNFSFPKWLESLSLTRDFIFLGYLIELLVVMALAFHIRGETRPALRLAKVFYIVFFLITVLPFYKNGEGELGYRLLLATTSLIGPALVLLFVQKRKYFSLPEFLLAVLVFQFAYYTPFKNNFSDFSKMEQGIAQLPSLISPDDYLIAHHGLEFFIDYRTNIRARIFLPDEPVKGETYRVVHVPYGVMSWLNARVEIYRLKKLELDKSNFVLTQKDWEDIKTRMKIPEVWQNADLKNPGHVYH
jgi:hypothetical protein